MTDILGTDSFRVMDDNRVRIYDQRLSAGKVAQAMALHGVEVLSLTNRAQSLEEYFLKLTAEEGEDGAGAAGGCV